MSPIYALVIKCSNSFNSEVGSLGDIEFPKGWYTYVGSSRDSSFSRLDRHLDVSEGRNDTRHWHIDYLLGDSNTAVCGAYIMTEAEEYLVAQSIGTSYTEGFGASDSSHDTHLGYYPTYAEHEKGVKQGIVEMDVEFRWIDAEAFGNIGELSKS